jgi:hypothetical protein
MKSSLCLQLELDQFFDSLKIIKREGKKYIYDPVRKNEYILAPEEITRQLIIQYLIQKKDYSVANFSVEKEFLLYGNKRRYDLIIYLKDKPLILIECKAPHINISEKTFLQISNYNLALNVPLTIVTNGRENYIYKLDFENESYEFMDYIPTKAELKKYIPSK